MSESLPWAAAEAVAAEVGRLVDADLSGVDDVLGLARVVEQSVRMLAVVQQDLVAEMGEQRIAEERGATLRQLLQSELRLSPGEAKARITRSADLRPHRALTGVPLPAQLPATAAAQAEGVLSPEHVRVIQHTMAALPDAVDPETRAQAEKRLVTHGREFDPRRLVDVGIGLRAVLDPDGTLTAEREQVERRELTFTRDLDGSCLLRGRLDPEGAEYVRVAVDSLAAPKPAEDGTPDPRTPGRRRADALIELARRTVAGGELPDSGGRPPQVLVTVSLADLRTKTGLADLVHSGGQISAEAALRMACDAEVVPHVVTESGQTLSVGRARRLASRAQRDALIARDRGCAAPGCGAPPAWTQAHHITHWANGGKTDLDNLILLCGRHHRAVHSGHLTIDTATGIPQVRPPPWRKAG